MGGKICNEIMGRVRRGGYVLLWWIGDHLPRHVHGFDKNAKFITRVNLDTMEPMDTPRLDHRIREIIRQLQAAGRL
jgi:hypothetical protein